MKTLPSGLSRQVQSGVAASTEPNGEVRGDAALARLPLVGVILNPKSHRNLDHDPEIVEHPRVLCVAPTSKEALERALHEFAERRIEVLAIGGGDGTIRDVLTRGAAIFGDDWPEILILPQGKTNALAIDLGIPGKWSLAQALTAVLGGERTRRRPLVVEDPAIEGRRWFGFIFGAGVFNAAIDAGQVAHRFGAFQSFAVGITTLFGILQALFGIGDSPWRRISPMRIRAVTKAHDFPTSRHGNPDGRFMAGFTTLNTFPLGLRPFRQLEDPAGVNYLVLDAPVRRAVAIVPLVFLGFNFGFLKALGVHVGSCDDFRIELADRFILDGEIFPPGNYQVSPGPELRFVIP